MGKWVDRAKGLGGGDNVVPIVPIVPIVPASLPVPIASGLRSLRAMPVPRMSNPEIWPEIVADAARIANEGWAAQALALGWSPLHLWGVSTVRGGLVDLEGLAVWLRGRRIVLLDAASCLVESGPRQHSIFNVRPMGGAVLLWEIGANGR